ncbi:MAG: hypothetical protein FJ291_28285, partial [Planctomycetes bacterium]|nr:hypothetical protein [Planctomycetota bacterium]
CRGEVAYLAHLVPHPHAELNRLADPHHAARREEHGLEAVVGLPPAPRRHAAGVRRAPQRQERREDRRQRADDRGQTTEDRRQRTEDRQQQGRTRRRCAHETVSAPTIHPAAPGFKSRLDCGSDSASVCTSTHSRSPLWDKPPGGGGADRRGPSKPVIAPLHAAVQT